MMKKILLLSFSFAISFGMQAQEEVAKTAEDNLTKNSFFLEGGANLPAFGWGSNYGYAKTGLELGLGWDYYFLKKWGFGLDLRGHQNGIVRKENTIDLTGSRYDPNFYKATTNSSYSDKWKGYSLAIGPSYRTTLFNEKFFFESYLKGGVGYYELPKINANYTITGNTNSFNTTLINGYYNDKIGDNSLIAPMGIAGLRLGYNLNENWMVYGTVNYKTTLINRDNYSYDYDRTIETVLPSNTSLLEEAIKEDVVVDGKMVDQTAGAFGTEKELQTGTGGIQSWGVLIGVKYTPTFIKKPKKKKEEVSDLLKKTDTVVIVKVDTVEVEKKKTIINVTVKDGPSGVIIPNADVALIDSKGNVVTTAKSDAFGKVKFEGIEEGDYTTKAMVYGKSTTIANISKAEFSENTINKDVLYEDLAFILLGKTMDLDTKKPISEVLVTLENKTVKGVKQGTSDETGDFTFGLSPETDYQVYGNKNGMFTNTNKVSTVGLKRSQTLFVELELGLQNPCGKDIKLNNIYYDLNKWFIREEAKVELNRVVNFMKNNPDVMIELSSHTDCRASDSYNKTLSQKRATSAVDYIVSQGADKTKIKGIGYGESKLLNKCADGVSCTEDEHQLNRRTEVKVICL